MKDRDEPVTRIRDVLRENPEGLNIVEIAEKTGLNRMSAAKYLGVLTANESVEVEMCGRAKHYSLSRRLPVTSFMEHVSKCYCITDSDLRVVQFNHWLPTISDIPPRELEGALNRVLVFSSSCRIVIVAMLSMLSLLAEIASHSFPGRQAR